MNKQLGLSLIELLITLALGSALMAVVINVYLSGVNTNANLATSVRLSEEGAFLSNHFHEEVELAGYFGTLDDTTQGTPSAIPDVCDTSWLPSVTNLTELMALPILSLNSAASGVTCRGTAVKEGEDILMLARVAPQETALASVNAASYYLQASPVNFVIDLGSNVSSFNLTQYGLATLLPVHEIIISIYFIDADDRLVRYKLSGSTFELEPLAENVETFRVDLGVDRSGDGAPNSTSVGSGDAYVATLSTIADWQNVVGVNTYIVLRAERETSGYTDDRTYLAGRSGSVGPFNDSFKRRLVANRLQLVNIAMRRQ